MHIYIHSTGQFGLADGHLAPVKAITIPQPESCLFVALKSQLIDLVDGACCVRRLRVSTPVSCVCCVHVCCVGCVPVAFPFVACVASSVVSRACCVAVCCVLCVHQKPQRPVWDASQTDSELLAPSSRVTSSSSHPGTKVVKVASVMVEFVTGDSWLPLGQATQSVLDIIMGQRSQATDPNQNSVSENGDRHLETVTD
jgi:hypothetical protein